MTIHTGARSSSSRRLARCRVVGVARVARIVGVARVVGVVALAAIAVPILAQAPAAPAAASTRQALVDELVVANHILANEGVLDGYGHVSVRNPANPNRYFLARAGRAGSRHGCRHHRYIPRQRSSSRTRQRRQPRQALDILNASFTEKSIKSGRMSWPSCTATAPKSSRSLRRP